MKTIAFKDIAGGTVHAYVNTKKPKQKRWERFFEALEDLKHTGNIVIYRAKGQKLTKLKTHSL